MLKDLIAHIASDSDMSRQQAETALGIVLNASERQGSAFSLRLFKIMPEAAELSAKAGEELGAATGVIARLIEQTPGGRMSVATSMIRNLQKAGLGHNQIAGLFPSISNYCEARFGLKGFAHLGDLLSEPRTEVDTADAVA